MSLRHTKAYHIASDDKSRCSDRDMRYLTELGGFRWQSQQPRHERRYVRLKVQQPPPPRDSDEYTHLGPRSRPSHPPGDADATGTQRGPMAGRTMAGITGLRKGRTADRCSMGATTVEKAGAQSGPSPQARKEPVTSTTWQERPHQARDSTESILGQMLNEARYRGDSAEPYRTSHQADHGKDNAASQRQRYVT
jgi:hypothetical protein